MVKKGSRLSMASSNGAPFGMNTSRPMDNAYTTPLQSRGPFGDFSEKYSKSGTNGTQRSIRRESKASLRGNQQFSRAGPDDSGFTSRSKFEPYDNDSYEESKKYKSSYNKNQRKFNHNGDDDDDDDDYNDKDDRKEYDDYRRDRQLNYGSKNVKNDSKYNSQRRQSRVNHNGDDEDEEDEDSRDDDYDDEDDIGRRRNVPQQRQNVSGRLPPLRDQAPLGGKKKKSKLLRKLAQNDDDGY